MIISSFFNCVKIDKSAIEKMESLEIVATLLGYNITYKDSMLSFFKNDKEQFYVLSCKGVEREVSINFWYVIGKTDEIKEKIIRQNQSTLDLFETIKVIENII